MPKEYRNEQSMDFESLEELLKHRVLLESLSEGFGVVDENNVFSYVNKRFGELIGYAADEMIGNPISNFLDETNIEKQRENISKRVKGLSSKYELEWITKSGRKVSTLISGVPIIDEEKNYRGAFAVITDLSEYKAAEKKYQMLAEQSPQAITIMTQDELLYYNPAFRSLVGYDDNDLIQMTADDVWNLVYPDDREDLTKRMRDKIAGRAVAPRYEYRYVRKNGEIRWVESFSNQVEYDGAPAIQTVTVDIGGRRQSERELRSAKDRALLYLDLMGHDLAQQMQVILNSAALMLNATDVSVKNSFYKIIGDAIKRCSRIIQEANSTEQLLSVPLSKRSLTQAVKTCIDAMSHAENITFETFIMGGDAKVSADEYLELLVSNILMNSVEHNIKERKRVWIRLESSGLDYLLSISDDGPGIPDSTKAGLFNMSRRFGGLGLHTVNHLVEKYGGRIELHDRVPGQYTQGLEVKIWLPKYVSPTDSKQS